MPRTRHEYEIMSTHMKSGEVHVRLKIYPRHSLAEWPGPVAIPLIGSSSTSNPRLARVRKVKGYA